MITSGRWLIIFSDPNSAFVGDNTPDPGGIRCYTSFEEIFESCAEIFRLLKRQRLTDTLPLTMTVGEALEVISPSAVTKIFRGVVVATHMSGPVKGRYPIWDTK